MVVQVLLQVGEHALDLVVCVGHPLAALFLVGEEVRQVEGNAVYGRSQPLVRVVRLARALLRSPRLKVDGLLSAIVSISLIVCLLAVYSVQSSLFVIFSPARNCRPQAMHL